MNKTLVAIAIAVLFSTTLFFPHPALSETVSYVSDQLTIPMRTGTSNEHRIISFIASGTALKVVETSEDGIYSRVYAPDGKEGWVENSKLMDQLSARDRLVSASNKLKQSGETIKELKNSIAELKAENGNLSKQLAASEKQGSALESDIEHLKKVTANPLALADRNSALEDKLNAVTKLNAQLKDENKRLSDNSTKEWFMLGAAVSLGSLLLGLLITRIRWQKKRSWGDL